MKKKKQDTDLKCEPEELNEITNQRSGPPFKRVLGVEMKELVMDVVDDDIDRGLYLRVKVGNLLSLITFSYLLNPFSYDPQKEGDSRFKGSRRLLDSHKSISSRVQAEFSREIQEAIYSTLQSFIEKAPETIERYIRNS